jgi:hypothetical protein
MKKPVKKPGAANGSAKKLSGVKWKKLEDSSMLDWKDGDDKEFAEYLGFVPPAKEGSSGKHSFKTLDGQTVKTWGSTVLDSRLQAYPIGQPVRIKYLGKQKGKTGGLYKAWDVFGTE